jgi:hypothetical protein
LLDPQPVDVATVRTPAKIPRVQGTFETIALAFVWLSIVSPSPLFLQDIVRLHADGGNGGKLFELSHARLHEEIESAVEGQELVGGTEAFGPGLQG